MTSTAHTDTAAPDRPTRRPPAPPARNRDRGAAREAGVTVEQRGSTPTDQRHPGRRPERNLTAADIMTAGEVAKLLTVAPTTVYEWARSGALPALRRGRVIRFRRWEIEAWIADELDGRQVT